MSTAEESHPHITSSKGLAITSMVLGISSIVLFLLWFISVPAAIVGLVLGIVALAKKYAGRGMAIAGVILNAVTLLFVVGFFLLAIIALPALQTSQRDTARKNEVITLQSSITAYTADHRGQMPAAQDINTTGLTYITSIIEEGVPTTSTAVYQVGVSCDGQPTSARSASITVLLESGGEFCADY